MIQETAGAFILAFFGCRPFTGKCGLIARRRRAGTSVLLALAGLGACQSSSERALADGAQAQQMLDAGQTEAARQLIMTAIGRRDDIAALYLTQAHVAVALNNRGSAYQAYANALALDATNLEALLGVAQLGLVTGHLREAERAADQALALNPQQIDALLVKGIAAIARNAHDGAIANADQILAISPNDIGALILKSRALALRGDREAALKLMRESVVRTGYTPEMTMSLVELYRSVGDGDSYFAMLERLRTLAPTNLDYRFDLIEALYKRGNRNGARSETTALLAPSLNQPAMLERVIRLWNGYDPEAPADVDLAAANAMSLEARMAIARYLIATGRPRPAQALLQPIATGWSNDIQGLFTRAADTAGDPAATVAAGRILEKDPGNGDALLVRARHAVATGLSAAAIVDYQRVVGNFPNWDEGYLGLAGAYRALGKPDGIRRAFEQGLHARPQSFPLVVAYVEQLDALRDGAHAIDVTRRFALDSPGLTRAWQTYAVTCRKYGGSACVAEAASGLARSRTTFGLDPAPGTPPPIALIGRLT